MIMKQWTHRLLRGLFWMGIPVFIAACNPYHIGWDELQVNTLDGKPFDLSTLKGKKIFLNFWATWCGPCLQEMPSIAAIKPEMEAAGFVFLFVSDESLEKLRVFQKRAPFPFDYYQYPRSVQSLGIRSIPQTYLINSRGEVIYAHGGMADWQREEMKALLRKIE